MLGGPEGHPVGSVAWAERIGQRLQLTVESIERTEQRELKYLPPVLEMILAAKPKPWTIWPPDNPARTANAWFALVTGEPIVSLTKLVEAYDPKSPLIRKLQAAEAEDEPLGDELGGRPKRGAAPRLSANAHSSTSTRRILARLQRDHPDVFAAYKAGVYPSPRAAGRAAGFIRDPTPLDALRRNWRKASPDERAAFLAEINDKGQMQ
jgi:hypothetical protein